MGRPLKSISNDQIPLVYEMWDAGMSTARIAQDLDSHSSTIKSLVVRSGRVWENRHSYDRHYAWKGGRFIDNNGYVNISVPPEWPYRAIMCHQGKNRVLEHRKVMADAIGRALLDSETVHHIDGDKLNNDLSNLQLRQGAHGQGIIMVCNSCGSHDVSPIRLQEQ